MYRYIYKVVKAPPKKKNFKKPQLHIKNVLPLMNDLVHRKTLKNFRR